MWIGSHGNLAVSSIRYDLYGPGRFDLFPLNRVQIDHLVPTAAVQVRVVEKTVSAAPADCGPAGTVASDPPGWQDGSATQVPGSDIPSPASSPAESGAAVQGFAQGQAVPAAGGLLDVMA